MQRSQAQIRTAVLPAVRAAGLHRVLRLLAGAHRRGQNGGLLFRQTSHNLSRLQLTVLDPVRDENEDLWSMQNLVLAQLRLNPPGASSGTVQVTRIRGTAPSK